MLEERAVTPVGSMRRRPVDVRVVAASNQRLEQMVEHHQFRADLFYRFNVARIDLPPLRSRPEDIGPIISHFIDEQNRRRSMRVGRPDPDLLARMRLYSWPGNVRELRNLVEALFIDPPQGRAVRLDDLPSAFPPALPGDEVGSARMSGRGWSRCCAIPTGTRWRRRGR